MINITENSKCCGCEACVQACPKQCISFSQDIEGFLYPKVDDNLCIGCGICEQVCPVINQAVPSPPIQIYAAKNLSESIRMVSSSGGVFTLLAEFVIHQRGVVFGAKFNENWMVVHDYTETIDGIADFRSSKYVQSRIGNCFQDVRSFLNSGRSVLFSGTPCQIAALKLFLRRDYENLLTIDVICHGVPSPKVWKMYLQFIKKAMLEDGKNNCHRSERESITQNKEAQFEQISFRDKMSGWKSYSVTFNLVKILPNGSQEEELYTHVFREDLYMKSFLFNLNLRPSCYQCPSKCGKSKADITLADFWGADHQMSDFDDDKGISLVMLNSQRALEMIEHLSIEKREVLSETALASNPLFYRSAKPHPNRAVFFRSLDGEDVDIVYLIDSLLRKPFCKKIQDKLKQGMKKMFKLIN